MGYVGRWGMINILVVHLPCLGLDELPQRQELCQGILVLVRGGDPGIQADLHGLMLPKEFLSFEGKDMFA